MTQMQATEEKNRMTDVPKVLRRRWLIGVCTLILLSVALLSLLPEMMRLGALHWLRDHGAGQAQIEDVNFNPFSGAIALIGLHAGEGLQVKRLTLHLDWLPLWRRTVLIRSLYLHGGHLAAHQDKSGGWQFGGIRLDDLSENGAPDPVDKSSDGEGSSWQVAPVDVQFSDIDLHIDSAMSDKPLSLSLPLELLMLHLQETDAAGHHLSLRIQTGPVHMMAADYQLVYTTLETNGVISLDSGKPDLLAGLMAGTLRVGLRDLSVKDMDGHQLASLEAVDIRDLGARMDSGVKAGSIALVGPKVMGAWAGKGEITAKVVKLEDIHLPMSGVLSAASLSLESVAASSVHGGPENVTMDTLTAQKVTVDPSGAMQLARLEAGGIKMENLPGSLTLERLQVQQLTADASGTMGFEQLQLDGVKADQMPDRGDGMRLQQLLAESFSVDAKRQLRLASLRLAGLELDRQAGKLKLAAADHLKLNGLSMTSADSGRFKALAIDGLMLPSAGRQMLGRIGSLKVKQAELEHGNYHVKSLHIGGMDLHIGRDKNGAVAVVDQFAGKISPVPGKQGRRAVSKPAVVKKSATPQILIDDLVVEKGSTVAIRDESVSPAFDTRMVVETLRIAPLDLSGKRAGALDTQLKLGKAGQLTVTGQVRPGPSPAAEVKISLKRLRMPELSGYVEQDFGKSIRTGQLDLDSTVKISDGNIDSANKLLIRSLTLGDSAPPGKQTGGLTMPLGLSLDMLRDDRGDIALDVPVKGPLDDPDINVHNIINKALLSSLSSGAMTYAALALQPYGSILVVANLAGGLIRDAARPRLTPMIFIERESVLAAPMAGYAEKIAGLMKSKGLRLQICGVATRSEGEPGAVPAPSSSEEMQPAMSDQQLLQLATDRSDHVQHAIALHGVAADQLFGCGPQIDTAKTQAQPRVELLLVD